MNKKNIKILQELDIFIKLSSWTKNIIGGSQQNNNYILNKKQLIDPKNCYE